MVYRPADLDDLRVTSGQVRRTASGFLTITEPTVRAEERAETRFQDAARLRFRYRGRTENVAELASGEVREQIGLKLRAQDTCNVLYVMWRIRPTSGGRERIVVSVKRNPGQSFHWQCGNAGYTTLAAVPISARARQGNTHRLEAILTESSLRARSFTRLTVKVDEEVVWQGNLPRMLADGLSGPAGFRTDNVDAIFRFWVGDTGTGATSAPPEPSRTLAAGGTGGRAFELSCDREGREVLVGIYGRARSSPGYPLDVLRQVGVICTRVDANGNWITFPYKRGSVGGGGGQPFERVCPPGRAVNGIGGQTRQFSLAGRFVNRLYVTCRPLRAGGGPEAIETHGPSNALPSVGGSGGQDFGRWYCDERKPGTLLFGGAGRRIDRIGLGCASP